MQGLTAKTTAVGGRLIFALDATASRQPTWDTACELQADMFREVAAIGGLSVQLVYYRGLAECRASRWVTQPEHLAGLMERIDCRMGHTQIGKVLAHARRESELLKVQALVFVGDAMEENPDISPGMPPRWGRLAFLPSCFRKGPTERSNLYSAKSQLTHGAYCRFDPARLASLPSCSAVAVYAAGGMVALESRTEPRRLSCSDSSGE